MLFLDLPAELIHTTLLHAVLSRGVKRALRLRLVCKLFSKEIYPALFESRLLDAFYTRTRLSDWYIRDDHGASRFWHSYLVYRVQNGTSPTLSRYLDILRVAERVRDEVGADLGTTIDTLCWPALEYGTTPPFAPAIENELQSPGLDLLCAAAYLNLITVAKRLLQEGHCPTSNSTIFSSPMQLAAWAGNANMLELFQEHLPELEGIIPGHKINRWKGKVGPGSIPGAAIRGDMDILRLAIYPPSRATPGSMDFAGQSFGKVARISDIGRELNRAQYNSKNVNVYKYLEGFFANSKWIEHDLPKYARLGNLEIVRYLLDAGVDIRGCSRRDGNPLVEACRKCHEDVVDLLLERGADPSFDGDDDRVQGDNAIAMAAKAGSLAIVRKLLNHGANLARPEEGYGALYWAVHVEHTAMVQLLVESGVDLGSFGGPILTSALSEGLDSMAELLQQQGVAPT